MVGHFGSPVRVIEANAWGNHLAVVRGSHLRYKRLSVESAATPSSASTRPIFIVGAPLSGVNVLAWSLAQHPNLSARLSEGDTDRILSAVERMYRGMSSSGEGAGDDRDPPEPDTAPQPAWWGERRPLLASPLFSDHVLGLSLMFPEAQFIHVVRDVDDVVALAISSGTDGRAPDPAGVSRSWLRSTGRCIEAEQILGPPVVNRANRRDLMDDPRRALQRIVRLLGEPHVEDCLWPLSLLQDHTTPPMERTAQRSQIDPAARTLSDQLSAARSSVRVLKPAERGPARAEALGRVASEPVRRRRPLHDSVGRSVAVLPEGSTVLVISKGDERLVSFPGRRGWHFPRAGDGQYAGHYPAHSEQAIRHLRALRRQGADYLVVPQPSMWWLDHYAGFHDHLKRYQVVQHDDECVIFSLRALARRAVASPRGASLNGSAGSGADRWTERDPVEPTMRRAFTITDRTPPTVLRRRSAGTLWAITAYYNPAGYRNKRRNYRRFRDGLRAAGVPLLTVEVAFERQRFELRRTDADLVVRLRGRDVLWQKERILNLGMRSLPDDCDAVAWVDADVLFRTPDWARQTKRLLDDYQVVQPFSHCVRLRPGDVDCDPSALAFGDGEHQLFYGVAFGVYAHGYRSLTNHAEHGHPGYAWAARRELLQRHGLFDANLLGNGDTDIAQAMFGNFDYWSLRKLGPKVQAYLRRWAADFFADVQGSVTFVPGLLMHLWHGNLKDRLYHQVPTVLSDFDPERGMKAHPRTGLYEWVDATEELRAWSRRYFAERREEEPVPDLTSAHS